MFSLLSQGYGTYDGTAKKDAQEIHDRKDYFSLEDFHLPPIGSNYQPLAQRDVADYQTGPRYENKAFKLPKVDDTKQSLVSVPKTYSTRKGALLLYAEDFFLPGSPKPKKCRRKLRKQPSVKLKTIGDLRNYILDYRNGGDPLFLALLQKQLSGCKDHSVRPGFSPKRYIATLGNSLEEDTWKRLAAAGSLKDPALLTYDPNGAPVHRDGPALCSLFPDKPQPYSTMSLPPFSPSSSMFESSFQFYKNGMSTGAASMISLNSESEEYAPSSRALSPAESLSNRLSEVEFLPQRKDPYHQLNAKQKEDLLSQLLLQKTLESINADLSDLQGWVTHYPDNGGGLEQDTAPVVSLPKTKGKHRGSLKSGSLTSIPRLPPIQSAGARPSTPEELKEESTFPQQASTEATVHQQRDITSANKEMDDILDPGSIHVDISSLDESYLLDDQREPQGEKDIVINSENTASTSRDDHAEQEEDQTKSASQSPVSEKSEKGVEHLPGEQRNGTEDNDMYSGSEKSIAEQGENDAVVGLDDIILSEDTIQEDEQHSSQDDEIKGVTTEITDTDDGQLTALDDSELQKQTKDTKLDSAETEVDYEDEGIGLDGNELDDVNIREDLEEELSPAAAGMTAITDEGRTTHDGNASFTGEHETQDTNKCAQSPQDELSSQQVEPPPPISLADLQGEARHVANRVLSRPQSGMVFMQDVKTAIAMWADRLSNLLGPPKQDARVSSASHQRPQLTGLAAAGQAGTNRPTRHRKVSRSAGPSPAALRNALKISGGELPGIEALRNLPPLPERFNKSGRTQLPSGDDSANTYREKLKDGSASTKRSDSSAAARSIPWERVSNADVQVDIFSYATKDRELSFQRVQAEELNDEGSEGEDEEFKTALNAIVTDVKQDYTLIEAKPRMAVSSPKKEQKPFQFPRPVASKPPAGLQNKHPTGQVKGKAKAGPPKKPVVAKKKAGKKPGPAKQQSKPSNKTTKTSKGKPETQNKDDKKEKTEDVSEMIITEVAEMPEPVRVDSETGEHEPQMSDRTVVSSALSRITSSRVSSKASDELNVSKNDVPSESSATVVAEVPILVPKSPEPQAVQHEPEAEQAPAPQEQKQAQESRAARRAAERAAAAERRRQEVERKRREREEAKKRAIEEETRLEQLRLEAEEEMKKREEERRKRREEREEAKRRERDEELERERLANMKAERERRAKEDWKKRQQQVLAHRKLEEEMRKEQERIEAELEVARLREEEERIKAMEESERIAFLEKMQREEEELRRRLEEQKRKEEEERRIREEERRQREEALAILRQKQLQRHLFIAGILKESHYLSLCQRLTRAFTFSYFELIPWNHLQHLQAPSSPVRDLLRSVKENIPPTIVEEDEDVEE